MFERFKKKNHLAPVDQSGRGGWFSMFVREPFAGAWQRNIEWKRKDVVSHFAIFSCISLISSDISKLKLKYSKIDSSGIWNDVPLGKYSFLDKPNHYQNRMQFFENWLISKLSRGNTYVLKGRDNRGDVTNLYVLSPDCVQILVSDSGDVFYQLSQDNLSGVDGVDVTVPASEIIHDRFNCLFHPLVGLSPIYACGLAAFGGIKILNNSVAHFDNMSRPGGIITAPGAISDENAKRIKEHWQQNYSGDNSGKTAVLGDDLKYTPISVVSAVDSQLVEQLRLSADIVCATFHVPPYKVIGDAPAYNNIEAMESAYYSQCLQVLIEAIELLLDQELVVPDRTGFEFDLDGLLRMDTKTQIESLAAEVKGGISTPNEARLARNKKSITGGDTVYMQEQNYSLEALAKRDAQEDPFGTAQPAPLEQPEQIDEEKRLMMLSREIRKELKGVMYDA